MKHVDMHPATKARVDAGAALGRRMSEYVQAIQLNERKHCSWQYVEIKYAEYKQALDELVFAAQKEGVAKAAEAISK
jgi:hypothetical protein